MGTGKGAIDGLKSYMLFTAGRLITYCVMGIAVGYMGKILDIKGQGFSLLSGIFFIISGVIMCLKDYSCSKSGCVVGRYNVCKGSFLPGSIHVFLAGIILSIVPCPPLIAVMTGSLHFQSVLTGTIIMFMFGLGTMLSPLILIAGAAGFLSKKIKESAPRNNLFFQRIAGIVIMVMGGYTIISIYK